MSVMRAYKILSWWWVFMFMATCFFTYAHASKKKMQTVKVLSDRLHELEIAKELALEEMSRLELEIHSQSDPLWIQLTLMKGLGLVPEGQKKVLFQEE
jgi:hypothetical protein